MLERTHDWSDDDALNEVRRLVDPQNPRSERLAFEETWLKNCAYYGNTQTFVMEGLRLRRPKNIPEHRVLYEANLLTGEVAKAVSKVTGQFAKMAIAPDSAHRRSRWAAKLSMRVRDHLLEVLSYDDFETLAMIWAAVCGSGYLKFSWDPRAGHPDRFYLDDVEDRAVLTQSAEQRQQKVRAGRYQDLSPGEITIDIVSPFSHYWDWNNKTPFIENNAYVSQVSAVPIDTLVELYGAKAENVRADDTRTGSIWYEEALTFLSSSLHTVGMLGRPNELQMPRARVVEWHERPSKHAPKGRWIVIGGDVVLVNSDNPNLGAGFWCPLVKFDWLPMTGRYVGISLVERLTQPQHQRNKARSTVIEFQNVYGHPAIFTPKGSGIPVGSFTIEPGAVYEYEGIHGPPTPGPVPDLPGEVLSNASQCEAEMRKISGDADPETSALPGQIRSAPGLQLMIEERNRPLNLTLKSLFRGRKNAHQVMLRLAQLYYTGRRVLHHLGHDNELSPEYFTGADLNTDIRIIDSSQGVQSDAARRAEILEAAQLGILRLDSPAERRAIQEALNYRLILDDVLDSKLQDEQNQWREIEEMIARPGQPAQIMPWDDHESHANVLERHLKSEEHRMLSPLAQRAIEAHWNQHVMAMQQQFEAQMAVMQAQQGGPGEASPPKPKALSRVS